METMSRDSTAASSPPAIATFTGAVEAQFLQYQSSVQEWVASQEALLQERRDTLDRREKDVAEQERRLAERIEQWEQQQTAWAKFIEMEEVVDLNVSGHICTAKRSTLCQAGGMLSIMFSGRWDDARVARDAAGRIYLELDGDCFAIILDWLRARVINPKVLFPDPPEDKKQIFLDIVEFLQFQDLEFLGVPIDSTSVGVEDGENQARNLHKAGLFDDAIKWFSKCIWLIETEQVPGINAEIHSRLYTSRAHSHMARERWLEAEEDCSSALRMNIDCDPAFYRRAVVRHELGKNVEALQDVQCLSGDLQEFGLIQDLRRKIEEKVRQRA